MPDGIGQLSAATGMSREELLDIATKVRVNHHKLDACKDHRFELIPNAEIPGFRLKHRYRCAHCGGEIDAIAHHWYQLGREHGRAAN